MTPTSTLAPARAKMFQLLSNCRDQRDRCLAQKQGAEDVAAIRAVTIAPPPPASLPATMPEAPDVGLSLTAAIVLGLLVAAVGGAAGILIDRGNRRQCE